MRVPTIVIAMAIGACAAGCGGSSPAGSASAAAKAAPSQDQDQAFRAVAREAIDDLMRRHPSTATDLGVHTYDRQFEDLSQAAIADESKALAGFDQRLPSPAGLSPDAQLDLQQLKSAIAAARLSNDVIRQWAKNADVYSSAVTNGAYVIMKRPYAPAAERLAALIEREQKMPSRSPMRVATWRIRRVSTPRSQSNRSTATSASSSPTCRRRSRRSPTRTSWPRSRRATTR